MRERAFVAREEVLDESLKVFALREKLAISILAQCVDKQACHCHHSEGMVSRLLDQVLCGIDIPSPYPMIECLDSLGEVGPLDLRVPSAFLEISFGSDWPVVHRLVTPPLLRLPIPHPVLRRTPLQSWACRTGPSGYRSWVTLPRAGRGDHPRRGVAGRPGSSSRGAGTSRPCHGWSGSPASLPGRVP